MDSLEAALAVENATVENFKNGMELTLKQLTSAFEKFNIKFINPDGESVKIRTIAESDFNQIIIGCNDGTFFVGDKNMRILERRI